MNYYENRTDITSIPASYRRIAIDKKGKEDKVSRIVLLFLCVMDGNMQYRKYTWNDQNTRKFHYSKNKHFDFECLYYSFWNKGNYGMVEKSSGGIYIVPQKIQVVTKQSYIQMKWNL